MKDLKEEKKRNKSQGQNSEVGEMGSRSKDNVVEQYETGAFKSGGEDSKKRKSKMSTNEKRKREKMNNHKIVKVVVRPVSAEDALNERNEHTQGKQIDGKSRKRGKRSEKTKNAGKNKVKVPHNEVQDGSKEENGAQFFEQVPDPNMKDFEEENKGNKSQGQNREVGEMGSRSKDTVVEQYETEAFKSGGEDRKKRKSKVLRKEKRKKERANKYEFAKVDVLPDSVEDALDEHNEHTQGKQKDGKSRKRGKRSEKTKSAGENKVSVPHNEVQNVSKEEKGIQFFKQGKSKKARGSKKDQLSSKKEEVVEKGEAEQSEVYEISSGDKDCSRGMKKWITEYHQSRPGLEILQQRIDDFMTAYEAREEQARKEQEALAAEGGWTVVVHHKGRKKTTDTESGIVVASVAQAAVLEREAKKKSKTKDLGVDFYRFQKREAQRNEIMALQSKFEQDKKRIQELRAARKFRPY